MLPKASVYVRVKGLWRLHDHYNEDQPNYSAEDHAMRDARLLIELPMIETIEVSFIDKPRIFIKDKS
jgi:hypothetical protein